MKGLVIYKSRYGATEQYAKWLAKALALPLYTAERTGLQELQSADYVLIGSSVYVGKMLLKEWLRKNLPLLLNKKLFLFVVCGGAASDGQQQTRILQANLPAELREKCQVFFLPGRLDKEKLSWSDKWILKIGAMLEKDPVKKAAMRNNIDAVSKTQIAGLVKAVTLFTSNISG